MEAQLLHTLCDTIFFYEKPCYQNKDVSVTNIVIGMKIF